MFKLYQVVKTREALPDAGLPADAVGAVVEVYSTPETAYEVEFCNGDGETQALLTLLPGQLAPVDAKGE